MKSTFFAITALATFAAAVSMDGSAFHSIGKRDAMYQPMMGGMRLRRAPQGGIQCPDQNYCDVNVDCGSGEQPICDPTQKVCNCKITNGAAACAAAGLDPDTWYTDKDGNVCCGGTCAPSDVACLKKQAAYNNAKAVCV
ncbi:hypothetical protein BST61_g3758 [Cercospora zeina]